MAIVFSNNARTTLASNISNSATTITVADGSVFPSLTGGDIFYCTIDDGTNNEIVEVTAISGNTLTVVRAQDNTSANAFVTGDLVELRLVAKVLETFPQLDVGELTADEFIGDLRGAVIFKAQAGEAVSKGDAVYVSGISGNTPVIALADADFTSKMPAFGLVLTAASANGSTEVVTFGTISGVDTSAFSIGDTLYVSTTAGALTNSKPTGEASLLQNIGKVQRSHASAGAIKVGGAGRTNDTPNLNDGNIFIGNASNQATTASLNTKIEDYLDGGTSTPSFATVSSGAINTTEKLTITNANFNNHIAFVRGSETLGLSPSGSQLLVVGGGLAPSDSASRSLGRSDKIWDDVFANTYRIGTTTVIDSSRNLTNIGTISSGVITADGLTLGSNEYIQMGGAGEFQIFNDGSNTVLRSSDNFLIQRDTSPRTSIKVTDSSGEVELSYAGSPKLATSSSGIDVTGTVTADGLTINSGSNNQVASFSSTDATAFIKVADNSTTANTHGYGAVGNELRMYANDSEMLRIKSAGNVDIKTGALEIGGLEVITSSRNLTNIGTISTSVAMSTSPSNIIYMAMSGTNQNGGGGAIRFDTSASNNDSSLYYASVEGIRSSSANGSNELAFFTTKQSVNNAAPTRKMTIDEDGNLLVGTTSAVVANSSTNVGTAIGAGLVESARAGVVAQFNRHTSDGIIVDLQKAGTTIGSIGVVTSDNLYIQGNSTHNGLVFGSNALIPFKNGAYTDNVCDIGGSSNRFKDLYLSGTISSGAITSSASITASGNSNNFGNTTIAALSATSGTFSASITASGNSNSFGNSSFGTISSGAITSSGLLALTPTQSTIQLHSTGYRIKGGSGFGDIRIIAPRFRIYEDDETGTAEFQLDGGNATFTGTISSGMQTITYTGLTIPNDSATGLRVVDSRTAAADVGGSISLTGAYNGTTLLGGSPYIRAYKANGTQGDYSFGLKFGIRKNGSATAAQALQIDEDKNATFAGTIDASGDVTTTGHYIADTHFRSSDSNVTLSAIGGGGVFLRPDGNGSSANQVFIASGTGNATFSGTIDSGAITSTGEIEATALDINGNGDISGNLTLGGYLAGPATFTIDPAAVGDNTGTVVIAGNLQVDGTTTTINSTTLTVDDKNITLASGSINAAAANGAGLTVDCGSDTDATFTYDGTNDEWDFNKDINVTGTISSGGHTITANTNAILMQTSSNPSGYYAYISANYNYAQAFSIKAKGAGNEYTLMDWGDGVGLEFNGGSTQNIKFSSHNLSSIGTISSGAISITTTGSGDLSHFNIDGADANYDFRSNSTSGYTTTFNMDNTGLEIGHNSSGRNLALRTDSTDRIIIGGSGGVDFQSNNLTSVGTIDSGSITTSGTINSGVHTITSSGTIGGSNIANAYLKVTDGSDTLGFDSNEIHSNNILYINSEAGQIRLRGDDGNGVALYNGATQFMSSALNLFNIGTISSGQINSTGAIFAGDTTGTAGGLVLAQRYAGNDNIATLGTMYSSGAWLLGYGIKPKNLADGYVSSFDNFSGTRAYLEFKSNAFKIGYAAAQQTTVGSDITGLSTPFNFDPSNGNLTITGTISSGGHTITNGNQLKVYRSGDSAYVGLYMDTGENAILFNSWGSKYLTLTRDGDLKLTNTTFLDSSRNLTNIGTINSGAITTTGKFQMNLGANPSPATTDLLYIGGDNLGGADGAIYIGNRGNGTGYGWRFYYEGSGSGNNNKLIIRSENEGSPVDALSFTQDGNATFASNIYTSGRIGINGTDDANAQLILGSNDGGVWRLYPSGNNLYAFDPKSALSNRKLLLQNTGTSGLMDVDMNGNFQMNGTSVIDSSRNIRNVPSAAFTGGSYASNLNSVTDAGIVLTQTKSIYSLINNGDYLRNIFQQDSSNNYVFGQFGTSLIADMYFQCGTSGTIFFNTNGSTSTGAKVDSGGNFIAQGNVTAYGSVSDIRRKENVEIIPDALDKLKTLDGITFNFKDRPKERMTGVIAQQVEKILPEAVYETTTMENEETKAVHYGNMVGLLIEAIKEQQKEIEYMKSEIKTLKENN